MRFAFMGTPDFAAVALAGLIDAGRRPVAVFTRAAQPSGRGQKERPSPVEALARAHELAVVTPRSLRKEPAQAEFAALDLDCAIVVAYGLILPQAVLDAPRLGCFNLHGSFLPRWRGAAPIQRAIMAGDRETGVQVMRMEAGLDTGPVIMTATTPITDDDTFASLHDRMAGLGAHLLPEFMDRLEAGSIEEVPQADAGVLYAEKISPAEAAICWDRPAVEVDRHIRGLSPFPGAYFLMSPDSDPARGDAEPVRIKALLSRVSDTAPGAVAPGTVIAAGDALTVACGSGAVELLRVQRAGRGAQSAAEFLRGFSIEPGRRL